MQTETLNKVGDTLAAIPFVTLGTVEFMTFNEFMEGATLSVGFIAGIFALLFQARRYFRSRKREKSAAQESENNKSCD